MPADKIKHTLKCPNGHFTSSLSDYIPEWCPYFKDGKPCDLPLQEITGRRHS